MSDVKRAIPALFNSSSTTGGIGLLQVCFIAMFRKDGGILKRLNSKFKLSATMSDPNNNAGQGKNNGFNCLVD